MAEGIKEKYTPFYPVNLCSFLLSYDQYINEQTFIIMKLKDFQNEHLFIIRRLAALDL